MLPIFCSPALSKSAVFSYTGNGVSTFTISITTVSSTITWFPDDSSPVVTTGTSHSLSYVPSSGNHICRIVFSHGLSSVIRFWVVSMPIVSIDLYKFTNLDTVVWESNTSFVFDLSRLPLKMTTIDFHQCNTITGDLSSIPAGVTSLTVAGSTAITGSLSSLSRSITFLYLSSLNKVTGSVSLLSPLLTDCRLNSCSSISSGDISHLTAIQSMNLSQIGTWTQSDVDLLIDYLYQAVLLDPEHFTYSHPYLNIGGTTPTPSGVYQFSASPSTGLEKLYYLSHLASHSWVVVWNGGSGP